MRFSGVRGGCARYTHTHECGMLVLCWTSRTVLSNSDGSTSVPEASRGAPAISIQNKSDQVTPDDDTVTHEVFAST